jgi:hypothetical protein
MSPKNFFFFIKPIYRYKKMQYTVSEVSRICDVKALQTYPFLPPEVSWTGMELKSMIFSMSLVSASTSMTSWKQINFLIFNYNGRHVIGPDSFFLIECRLRQCCEFGAGLGFGSRAKSDLTQLTSVEFMQFYTVLKTNVVLDYIGTGTRYIQYDVSLRS